MNHISDFDFTNTNSSIHFIGIGGISMSGLAELLLNLGFHVSGSDSSRSELTDALEKKGAKIFIGQRAENIDKSIDTVIATAAIREDNEELMQARKLSIPVISRAVLLGQVMKLYKNSICVAGTHGKTTTTSMISEIFLNTDINPTISVGGMLKSIGGNFYVGSNETFITEACEYTNSFLDFFPTVEIILNIDADHLDFFKDLDDIKNSFNKFAKLLPKEGTLIINSDIPNIREFTNNLNCNIITFGTDISSDYSACDITYDDFGRPSFTLLYKGEKQMKVSLGVTGEHNVYNSLSAIATARLFDVDDSATLKALASFSGTDRRFQYKGEVNGFTIIDDYAHHPTEIQATISAAKKYPHNELYVLFQSHTYTRTKALMNEFAETLKAADHVLLVPIYPARETDNLGISSDDLCELIKKQGTDSISLKDFAAAEEYILKNLKKSDLLITMGAGDVVKVGDSLLNR